MSGDAEQQYEDLSIDDIDLESFLLKLEEDREKSQLRKENPWVRDIIRVLWGSQSWITMDQLTTELWALRHPSGVPMPRTFRETVQSALNHHTSQSNLFKGRTEDDLFFSPKGKGSGTWAVHRERALIWLQSRRLPPA